MMSIEEAFAELEQERPNGPVFSTVEHTTQTSTMITTLVDCRAYQEMMRIGRSMFFGKLISVDDQTDVVIDIVNYREYGDHEQEELKKRTKINTMYDMFRDAGHQWTCRLASGRLAHLCVGINHADRAAVAHEKNFEDDLFEAEGLLKVLA